MKLSEQLKNISYKNCVGIAVELGSLDVLALHCVHYAHQLKRNRKLYIKADFFSLFLSITQSHILCSSYTRGSDKLRSYFEFKFTFSFFIGQPGGGECKSKFYAFPTNTTDGRRVEDFMVCTRKALAESRAERSGDEMK